ncbi:MAG: ferrous iron transport protein A [Planctomycetia bacterium]|nr:ferrous iron transport protein A [Planctomycetia bacterium]
MNSISDFKPGDIVTIIGFTGEMELQSRLVEMGFIPGIHLRIVKYAPWKGLVELKIRNYLVSIRMRDAKNIKVKKYDL